jgi:hypothetical protein
MLELAWSVVSLYYIRQANALTNLSDRYPTKKLAIKNVAGPEENRRPTSNGLR